MPLLFRFSAAMRLSGQRAFSRVFAARTGIPVINSYGATVQLAQQIENGAPFDVFAAADAEHVDGLIRNGKVDGASRRVYARGQLALWAPRGGLANLAGLAETVRAHKAALIAV